MPLAMRHSFGQRIDDLDKCKSMEVGVAGANPANAVFAHEDRGMRTMQQVAGEGRKFR